MEFLLIIVLVWFAVSFGMHYLPDRLGPEQYGDSLRDLGKEGETKQAISFLADHAFSVLIVDADDNLYDVIGFDKPPNRRTRAKLQADCQEAIQDPENPVRQLGWVLVERGYYTDEEIARHIARGSRAARALAQDPQLGDVGLAAPVIRDDRMPPVFGELDSVATEAFEFLVSEHDSKVPVVQYWRDYFLVYELPSYVTISVGMERSWLVPFIFVQFSADALGRRELRDILRELDVPVDTAGFPLCESIKEKGVPHGMVLHKTKRAQLEAEWPVYLEVYAKALREHYDAVVERIMLGEEA